MAPILLILLMLIEMNALPLSQATIRGEWPFTLTQRSHCVW